MIPNPNRRVEYFANRDFDFKNLQCRAGERLPNRWQDNQLVKGLKSRYGDACVTHKTTNAEPLPPTPVQDSVVAVVTPAPQPEEAPQKRGRKKKQ